MRLAPIYLALLVLVALSLVGFGVASSPRESAPLPPPQAEREKSDGRSFEGALKVPPPARDPRHRSTWM